MIRMTESQIVYMHSFMISQTGGSDGIRDKNMLDSALESPFLTFDGSDLYPSLIQKAARLCCSIIKNHPFVDGNKRTGIHSMLVFLALNGIEVSCTQKELINTGLSLADGSLDYEQLVIWLNEHID